MKIEIDLKPHFLSHMFKWLKIPVFLFLFSCNNSEEEAKPICDFLFDEIYIENNLKLSKFKYTRNLSEIKISYSTFNDTKDLIYLIAIQKLDKKFDKHNVLHDFKLMSLSDLEYYPNNYYTYYFDITKSPYYIEYAFIINHLNEDIKLFMIYSVFYDKKNDILVWKFLQGKVTFIDDAEKIIAQKMPMIRATNPKKLSKEYADFLNKQKTYE